MQRGASGAHVSVSGLWEEKEKASLSLDTWTKPLQLGQGSGGLRAASLRAPGHHEASGVHLALARLRGGVMLTGELSGAAQRTRLRGLHARDAHIGLCEAVSYLRSQSTPPHPLSPRAARLRDSREMRPRVMPLDGLLFFLLRALQLRPRSHVHMVLGCTFAHPG